MTTQEARKFVDEVRGLEKNWMLDLGHPLLNRVADSFVKAAGIGAIQAVTRDSYFMAIEGNKQIWFMLRPIEQVVWFTQELCLQA